MNLPPIPASGPHKVSHRAKVAWFFFACLFFVAMLFEVAFALTHMPVATIPDSREIKPTTDAQQEITASPDYQAGYRYGKETGLDDGSKGLNIPAPRALQLIASGYFKFHGKGDEEKWKAGFKIGLEDGLNEAKRTNRPATANANKYDQRSYWAGYKAGYEGDKLEGDERTRMFRRCDAEVATNHYDKKAYDEGFVAGVADARKQGEQKHDQQALTDRKEFEKRSYNAGYRAEKEMHKHNGIARTIEEAIAFNQDARQWDQKSWRAGYNAAHEEDTRP
jgi:hypothetical protein